MGDGRAIPHTVRDWAISHTVPGNDIREHDTRSRGRCWCSPLVTPGAKGRWVVAHNAADGRELRSSEPSDQFDLFASL